MKVVIPSQLRSYTGGEGVVEAEGATVDAVLQALDRRFPGIRFRVIDEQDRVRRHILLFVGEDREEDLGRAVSAAQTLTIVGALSGG